MKKERTLEPKGTAIHLISKLLFIGMDWGKSDMIRAILILSLIIIICTPQKLMSKCLSVENVY